MLAGLTPRVAKALRMRFGIDMTTDQTLEEIGANCRQVLVDVSHDGRPTAGPVNRT